MGDLIAGRWQRRKLPKWLKAEVHAASLAAQAWGEVLQVMRRPREESRSRVFPAACIKDPGEKGYYVVMHSEDWEQWFGDRLLKMLEETRLTNA